jgi:hypothetical protein
MNGRQKVLVDSCAAGEELTLEQVIKSGQYDYYTVKPVIAEWEGWEDKNMHGIHRRVRQFKKDMENIRAAADNDNYKEIEDNIYVTEELMREDDEVNHSPYVARLIEKALKGEAAFKFEGKRKGKLTKIFEHIQREYELALIEYGLTMEFSGNHVCVKPKGKTGTTKDFIKIEKIGDLDRELSEYSVQEQYCRSQFIDYLDSKKTFFAGMQLLNYFRDNPDKVIDCETQPKIKAAGELSAKSVAKHVVEQEFGGRLSRGDLRAFYSAADTYVRQKLSNGCSCDALRKHNNEVMKNIKGYAEAVVDKHNGVFKENNVETDANIVSAAVGLVKGLNEPIGIMTQDGDVKSMVNWWSGIYGGDTPLISCV